MADSVIHLVRLPGGHDVYRGARVRDGIPEVTIDGQAWAKVDDAELATMLLGQVPREVRESVLTSYFQKLVPLGTTRADFDDAIAKDRGTQQRHALDVLARLSDEDRLAVLNRFCSHCGTKQPDDGRGCQCWNDE